MCVCMCACIHLIQFDELGKANTAFMNLLFRNKIQSRAMELVSWSKLEVSLWSVDGWEGAKEAPRY